MVRAPRPFRRLSLRAQLLLLQLVIVLGAVAGVGVAATLIQARQIRASYEQQMIGVAQSVARLPAVREAFDHPAPAAEIQPIAELIRRASGVTYVVVTDEQGIRYSHPNPERLNEMVSTDPSIPLSGQMYVGTQTGTLGTSWRVKVPVRDGHGEVIGSVSVGVLESQLRDDLYAQIPRLLVWVVGAALLGLLGAYWVSRLVWRRIHQLEPEQIAALLETRDAMLHGIGEALVAVDEGGRIALVNDEAGRLLGVTDAAVGRHASRVLDGDLVALLEEEGQPEPRMVLSGERILLARRSDALVDGGRVGTVLILTDRTELHALLHELDGARDLSEALRAQAHEFANKMHVVAGLLEIGRSDDAVDFITGSGYGGALGATALAPGITEPAVTALLMAKAASCRERGIQLVVTPESTLGSEEAPDVVTVLGNLIDNAAEATGVGGVIRIAVTGTPEGTVLLVEDDGPGVDPADRVAVLEAGWSTSAHAGRGIGLALVARIARRREGSVEIGTSSLGGARFEVLLGPGRTAEVGP